MMYALVTFYGRRKDAIGITYRLVAPAYGSTPENLLLNLYDRYEHISSPSYVPITEEEYFELMKKETR